MGEQAFPQQPLKWVREIVSYKSTKHRLLNYSKDDHSKVNPKWGI